jgi:hypothetical protein
VADTSRIEELRRRVQRDPASIAFAQLAEEYRRAGRYRDAIETCEGGLSHHPGYLSARVTLGRSLLEMGDLDAAQVELGQVLRAAPENLAALKGLAEIHHRRGELRDALAHYRMALEFARTDPELQHLVEQIEKELEPGSGAVPIVDGLSFEEVKDAFLNLSLPEGDAAQPQEAQPGPPAGRPAEGTGARRDDAPVDAPASWSPLSAVAAQGPAPFEPPVDAVRDAELASSESLDAFPLEQDGQAPEAVSALPDAPAAAEPPDIVEPPAALEPSGVSDVPALVESSSEVDVQTALEPVAPIEPRADVEVPANVEVEAIAEAPADVEPPANVEAAAGVDATAILDVLAEVEWPAAEQAVATAEPLADDEPGVVDTPVVEETRAIAEAAVVQEPPTPFPAPVTADAAVDDLANREASPAAEVPEPPAPAEFPSVDDMPLAVELDAPAPGAAAEVAMHSPWGEPDLPQPAMVAAPASGAAAAPVPPAIDSLQRWLDAVLAERQRRG